MNICVAELSSSTTGAGLKQLFEQFGEVKDAKVIMDKETQMSKCYGFVEMVNAAEGHTAIAELNEAEVDGSVIVVKESQPKGAGRPSFGGGNRGGSRGGFGGGGGDRKFQKPGFSSGRPRERSSDGFDSNFKKGGYRSREDNY